MDAIREMLAAQTSGLQRRVDELEAALRPFAELAKIADNIPGWNWVASQSNIPGRRNIVITTQDVRNARAALENKEKSHDRLPR